MGSKQDMYSLLDLHSALLVLPCHASFSEGSRLLIKKMFTALCINYMLAAESQ